MLWQNINYGNFFPALNLFLQSSCIQENGDYISSQRSVTEIQKSLDLADNPLDL